MKHTGTWRYHDDDCRCSWADLYCTRDGFCWSCCGASKEDSECSAAKMHPTHWQHRGHRRTVAGYEGVWPVYKDNEEIKDLFPESFEDAPSEQPDSA